MDDKRPLGVRIEDFRQNLTNLINDSGLPAYILELQISQVLTEVSQIGRTQLENERKEFCKQEENQNGNDE